jgi:hypothetical protein
MAVMSPAYDIRPALLEVSSSEVLADDAREEARVKLLKIPILLFGAAGLALTFLEGSVPAAFEHAPLHVGLIVLGWAAPMVAGLLSIVRPPLRAWHAAAALAGFVVVAIRLRVWKVASDLAETPLEGQLSLFALAGGLVTSSLALARPESGA